LTVKDKNSFAYQCSLLAFRLVQNNDLLLLAMGLWEEQKTKDKE